MRITFVGEVTNNQAWKGYCSNCGTESIASTEELKLKKIEIYERKNVTSTGCLCPICYERSMYFSKVKD